MSLVAGIDYSTHAVDVVLLDEDTNAATWVRFELEGRDAFDRARSVRDPLKTVRHAAQTWMWDDVIAIGIEQPRGHHGTVHLARIQGAILACLPRSVLVQPWNPAEWRKAVGLPGNASKEQVGVHAFARWRNAPIGEVSYDCTDAYCIALATRNALQKEEAA